MSSTPLNQYTYYNNPLANTYFIAGLGQHDTEIYTLGYVSALQQVMEALGDKKRILLQAMLDSSEDRKARLMTYVALLDDLDESLGERVVLLEKSILSGPSEDSL